MLLNGGSYMFETQKLIVDEKGVCSPPYKVIPLERLYRHIPTARKLLRHRSMMRLSAPPVIKSLPLYIG